MDLSERISRRRTRHEADGPITDWTALSPVAHLDEPVGRGGVLETVLNAIDPVFERELPEDVYVWGPSGSGKSALLTALVSQLSAELGESPTAMYRATREGSTVNEVRFVYIDTRNADSRHQVYRALLTKLGQKEAPSRGVSTDELEARLQSRLGTLRGVVSVVDHVAEPETPDFEAVRQYFAPLRKTALVTVSQVPPAELEHPPETTLECTPYRDDELIDILSLRASRGFTSTVGIDHIQSFVDWAHGDAHRALCGLYAAAMYAQRRDHAIPHDEDMEDGRAAVPAECVNIGRVLALPENKRDILLHLLDLDRRSIDDCAKIIGGDLSLSDQTVRRYLYEFADQGLMRRTPLTLGASRSGRRPSRLEPLFPPLVVRHLWNPNR